LKKKKKGGEGKAISRQTRWVNLVGWGRAQGGDWFNRESGRKGEK